MATQITNQASLTYNSGQVSEEVISNIATITLQGPLNVRKRTLEESYRGGKELVYTLFLDNTGSTALTGVTIVDDLGTYTPFTGVTVTPLTYVGPSQLYTNGEYTSSIVPVVSASGDTITYTIANVPAGGTIMITYKVEVNEYAQMVPTTSSIKNTMTASAPSLASPVTTDFTVNSDSYADVKIEKSMSPNPVLDGSQITYTFDIYNYGNIAATEVTLQDVFANDPTGLIVNIDGVASTEFDYNEGIFLFPGVASTYEFEIPAATFTQDTTTGVVTVEPGYRKVVITGTI